MIDQSALPLVNQQDPEGYTPLHIAVLRGHRGWIDFLLGQPGININEIGGVKEPKTPLDIAIDLKNEIIEAVLRKRGGFQSKDLRPPQPSRFRHNYRRAK